MDKRFLSLMMVFFLAFGLFMAMTVFSKQIATFTRAKEESVPSSETSLIFAWPLTSSVNSTTPVNINVFIRNANNQPLSSKKVVLNSTLGLLNPSEQTTDKSGKASFSLISSSAGLAEVSAIVENSIQLKQKISIKFE